MPLPEYDSSPCAASWRLGKVVRLTLAAVMSFVAFGGCVVVDDLQVHNGYSFHLTLRRSYSTMAHQPAVEVLGTVAPHSTSTFEGAAGKSGMSLDRIVAVDPGGKVVQQLSLATAKPGKQNGCGRASSVWVVSVAPASGN
jgi:hypothetical protein